MSVQAQSHTFTYDALLHFLGRHEKIRPYVAGGVGVKFQVAEHFVIPADVRDYITTFPNRLFSPVANAIF